MTYNQINKVWSYSTVYQSKMIKNKIVFIAILLQLLCTLKSDQVTVKCGQLKRIKHIPTLFSTTQIDSYMNCIHLHLNWPPPSPVNQTPVGPNLRLHSNRPIIPAGSWYIHRDWYDPVTGYRLSGGIKWHFTIHVISIQGGSQCHSLIIYTRTIRLGNLILQHETCSEIKQVYLCICTSVWNGPSQNKHWHSKERCRM